MEGRRRPFASGFLFLVVASVVGGGLFFVSFFAVCIGEELDKR